MEILSFSPSVIVSGGAKGIDSYARQFAAEQRLDLKEYLPEYQKYGKPATMIRNTQIIQDSDVVFAFPSPDSKGTLDSIRKAKKYNKQLIVHEL
jgi:hypothetical protein